MPVWDHLKDIYEYGNYLSADWLISDYLLSHQSEIDHLTLTALAERTKLAKSSVSKFVNKMTAEGSYANFQVALVMEAKKNLHVSSKIEYQARNRVQSMKKLPVSSSDAGYLSEKLINAGKIMLITNRAYVSSLEPFVDTMLHHGIKCRIVGNYYSGSLKDELMALSSSDVVMLIMPDQNLYEYSLNVSYEDSVSELVKCTKGNLFFLGKEGDTTADKVWSIRLWQEADSTHLVSDLSLQMVVSVTNAMNSEQ